MTPDSLQTIEVLTNLLGSMHWIITLTTLKCSTMGKMDQSIFHFL